MSRHLEYALSVGPRQTKPLRGHALTPLLRPRSVAGDAEVRAFRLVVPPFAVPLPALPRVIPFPVYGLADYSSGLRWLTIWNYPDRLSTISLGHGHPDDGASTLVTTDSEVSAAESLLDDEDDETPPPLLAEAAFNAACSLVEGPWSAIADFARLDVGADGSVTLNGWDQIQVLVDGAARPAWTRVLGVSSAIVVDLPPVAVSVIRHGTSTGPPPALTLVTDRLADYPPLPEPERPTRNGDDDGLDGVLDRLEHIPAVQSMSVDRNGSVAPVDIGVTTDETDALIARVSVEMGCFPFSLHRVCPNRRPGLGPGTADRLRARPT